MKKLTPEIEREATLLINRLRSGELDDRQISDIVVKLRSILPDPEFMVYVVEQDPEWSAERIIRKAFEYKPILL